MNIDIAKFTACVPSRVRPYVPVIVAHADDLVDPFLIYGVGSRETLWGLAAGYRSDAGDWTPRLWSHDRIGKFPHVNVVGQKDGLFLVMPVDKLGWGRGLLQLDYVAEYEWLMTHDWRKPAVHIPRSIEHLRHKFAFMNSTVPAIGYTDGKIVTVKDTFATRYSTQEHTLFPGTYKDPRPLLGGVLESAAVAAYNADKAKVLASIVAGGIKAVDVCTTEKNYSKDVRGRAAMLRMRYDRA